MSELDRVFCGKCGCSLEERASVPVGRREPCGTCGSILRGFGWQLATPASPMARTERNGDAGRLAEALVDKDLRTSLRDYLRRLWPIDRISAFGTKLDGAMTLPQCILLSVEVGIEQSQRRVKPCAIGMVSSSPFN